MRRVTPEEMRECQLRMLNIFADFCEEHHLRYSLGGGTLLGAVRHKGFIPWDDDIDVMMPRYDYEYFLHHFEGVETHTKVEYFLHDKKHRWLFAKMYDTRTDTLGKEYEKGVYIDIFPIDFFSDMDKVNDIYRLLNKIRLYIFRVMSCLGVPLKNVIWRRIYWVYELLKEHHYDLWNFTHRSMYKQFYFLVTASREEDSKIGGAIVGAYDEKELMQSRIFLNYTHLPFEGRLFMCIKEYDAYLAQHYGNYMQLPPERDRKPSHGIIVYWV